jgi:hypothetical protein
MKARPIAHAPSLSANVQSANLPMMEECDRRVSLSATCATTERIIRKSLSMAAIGSQAQDDQKALSGRSLVIPATPPPDRRWDGRRVGLVRLKPSTTRGPVPFSVTLLDIAERSAPTATDEVIIRLEFGFSLDERSNTSSIILPLDVLQRAGGHLNRFVQGHLRTRGVRAAEEQRGMRIVSDAPSFEDGPDLTEGVSETESDVDSEEYVSSALLRWVLHVSFSCLS